MSRTGAWLTGIPVALVALLAQSALWTDLATDTTRGGRNDARLSRPAQFVDAISADVISLNPVLYADATSGRVIEQVFEGLLSYNEALELVPALAQSYTLRHDAWLPIEGDGCSALFDAARADPDFPTFERGVVVAADAVPAHVAETSESVAAHVYLQLPDVVPDLEAKLAPALASVSERCSVLGALQHRPVVTFELRDDVTWHDGEPFDAQDVRFTYDAIMDEGNRSPRRADYVPIATLDTPTAHQVVVTYRDLYSPGVSVWGIGLLPEHRLNPAALAAEAKAVGKDAVSLRDSQFNRAPVGTGPYRFARWERDREFSLTRNPAYWRDVELPAERVGESLAGLTLRVMPDQFAQELEFKAGGLDAYAVQPHQVARYRADTAANVVSGPGLSYSYIGYNLRRPPFGDARVRRALGMAINTEDIIKYVLYGEGERTTGPFARETPWYDHDVPPIPFDPAAALALLREAGFERDAEGWLARDGKRLEFNLITNNGNEQRKAIVSIVQDAWRAIGVKVETQLLEWSVFLKDYVNVAEFDALVLGWSMTPDYDLFQLWHSSQAGPRQLNFVGYNRPEADALIEELRREYAEEALLAKTHALHAMIAEDQPYTFLYSVKRTTAFAADVSDVDDAGAATPIVPSNTGARAVDLWRWRRAPVLTP